MIKLVFKLALMDTLSLEQPVLNALTLLCAKNAQILIWTSVPNATLPTRLKKELALLIAETPTSSKTQTVINVALVVSTVLTTSPAIPAL